MWGQARQRHSDSTAQQYSATPVAPGMFSAPEANNNTKDKKARESFRGIL